VLLRREGWTINMKKIRRIYNQLGLHDCRETALSET